MTPPRVSLITCFSHRSSIPPDFAHALHQTLQPIYSPTPIILLNLLSAPRILPQPVHSAVPVRAHPRPTEGLSNLDMASQGSGSEHERLKYVSERVKQYVVDESVLVLRVKNWRSKFRCHPHETRTIDMKIGIFPECAEIIAKNVEKVPYIPKVIFHFCKQAISLREADAARWEPLSKVNEQAKKTYDDHIGFIDMLKDVLRILKLGENRRRPRNVAPQVPTPGTNLSRPIQTAKEASPEVEEPSTDEPDPADDKAFKPRPRLAHVG
jgi:hypothetical protein